MFKRHLDKNSRKEKDRERECERVREKKNGYDDRDIFQ
jgi:hypothetical protein